MGAECLMIGGNGFQVVHSYVLQVESGPDGCKLLDDTRLSVALTRLVYCMHVEHFGIRV